MLYSVRGVIVDSIYCYQIVCNVFIATHSIKRFVPCTRTGLGTDSVRETVTDRQFTLSQSQTPKYRRKRDATDCGECRDTLYIVVNDAMTENNVYSFDFYVMQMANSENGEKKN